MRLLGMALSNTWIYDHKKNFSTKNWASPWNLLMKNGRQCLVTIWLQFRTEELNNSRLDKELYGLKWTTYQMDERLTYIYIHSYTYLASTPYYNCSAESLHLQIGTYAYRGPPGKSHIESFGYHFLHDHYQTPFSLLEIVSLFQPHYFY